MPNKWNIPEAIEKRIRVRDKKCVYCGREFTSDNSDRATWEHIDNDETNISEANICLCCASCNASKGTNTLTMWLKSDYCRRKNINVHSMAKVIRRYLLFKH